MGERQKAKYRLIVLGLVAILGPPAFGLRSVFAILYSILLVLYALWALRLTVVFADDASLGYLLCLFDGAIVTPLLLWGATVWLIIPVALLWAGGLYLSVRAARRLKVQPTAHDVHEDVPHDGIPAFGSRAGFVHVLRELYAENGPSTRFSLVVVRLQRYEELALLSGADTAARALGALARRVQRVMNTAGDEVGMGVGYRITDDRIAFVVEGEPPELGALLEEARRTAALRLVEGHKLEVSIGCASFPHDGATPRELLVAADRSAAARMPAAGVVIGRSRLAVGS